VNAVCPGFIESDMTKDLNKEALLPFIPLKRFGTPEEVRICIYVCIYIYIYIYIYTCIYTYVYDYTYIYMCMHIHIYFCIYSLHG
jgi:hypothetical protein